MVAGSDEAGREHREAGAVADLGVEVVGQGAFVSEQVVLVCVDSCERERRVWCGHAVDMCARLFDQDHVGHDLLQSSDGLAGAEPNRDDPPDAVVDVHGEDAGVVGT